MSFNLAHIIEGCKRKDGRAQETLYRHCYPGMIKICLRYAFGDLEAAAGLYNAAMLKVFTHITQFRDEGAFMGWVRTTVVHVCIDSCRSKSKLKWVDMRESNDYLVPVLPEIYHKLSGDDILQLVYQLPKNTCLVFNLFVMEGYKHEEIGRILGISPGTSKWHLNEARRLLKEKIESLFKKENLANAI